MNIPYFRAQHNIDEIAQALSETGVVIVEEMLGQLDIQNIQQELNAHLENAESSVSNINPVIEAFFGDKTKHVAGLATKSKTFVDAVLCHPVMLGLCDQILLPNCANYQLNLGHLMVRGPGSTAQILHRDEDIWIHLPRPHKEVEVATMTALVDFTAENGATLIVPGSHRWDRDRQPQPEEIKAAIMPAGASVIYLGSTLHAGGSNTSLANWRAGLHMSYAVGWLRTEENNYLTTPPKIARTLSPRAQDLLGYSVHDAIKDRGGYLGMVELKDPMKMLLMEGGEC